MSAIIGLSSVAGFLAIAALAIVVGRKPAGSSIVYGASLIIAAVGLANALFALVAGAPVTDLTLPFGLPLLGAHFRLDALSAFFLLVVNLGGSMASLYGLGYGRHESSPLRILPYFPAYLAGMNLVLLADDAFTFLIGWEFMSLASWALVLAHHRASGNARAAFIYIVMASAGMLCLLLTFGLLAGPDGGYAFAEMRSSHLQPTSSILVSVARACRGGLEGWPGAVACLVAARASGRAQSRLCLDERRDDQGRHLRLHPYRLRPDRRNRLVDKPDRTGTWSHHRSGRHALRDHATGHQASPRLQHGRECRHHLCRARARHRVFTPTTCRYRRRWR